MAAKRTLEILQRLDDVYGTEYICYAIPFNANNLRRTVYLLLTIGMFVWSILLARQFRRKSAKVIYCGAVFVWNLFLTGWIVKAFMWA